MRTRAPHIAYSREELAFLEERKTTPRRDLHAAFVEAFGRHDVSLQNLKALMKRKGWLTGRDGTFDKGNVPWSKGRKLPYNEARARTQFKPGHRPTTFRGAGHERLCGNTGYVIMIVDEPNPWTGAATRPVQKHRWLWEREHGPVPEGMVLKSLDGDRTNTDPSNWEPVPRALVPKLSLKRGYDHAPEELRPAIMTLAKIDLAIDERKKKAKEAA